MRKTHQALVRCMTLASAADSQLRLEETRMIGSLALHLPVFAAFDLKSLPQLVDDCLSRLNESEDALDILLDELKADLPADMYETAYALAVEVMASNLHVGQEELTFLQMLRQKLELDRLVCTGIERGARARFNPGIL